MLICKIGLKKCFGNITKQLYKISFNAMHLTNSWYSLTPWIFQFQYNNYFKFGLGINISLAELSVYSVQKILRCVFVLRNILMNLGQQSKTVDTTYSECWALNFCTYRSVCMDCALNCGIVRHKNRFNTVHMITLAFYYIVLGKKKIICVTNFQMRSEEGQTTLDIL